MTTAVPKYQKHVIICTNQRPDGHPRGDCLKCGGMEIRKRLANLMKKHGLKNMMRANKAGCLDVCELGPVLVIYPQNVWYCKVKPEDVEEIFETSILNDGIVERLVATEATWKEFDILRKKSK